MKSTLRMFLSRFFIPLSLLTLSIATFGYARASSPAEPETERMTYLDDGVIKLGVDLNLGGAITYLSKSGTTDNIINDFDWGRQIQMSDYSGPVPYEPNGKLPNKTWALLGWNPIQSGDCYGNRSKVIDWSNDGKELYVRCVPMQWPLNNVPGKCVYECWIRLEGNTAQIRCRLINHRDDHTQYPARFQELPAVYVNGPFDHIITYKGDKPFQHDALSQMPSVFKVQTVDATENWAALVNDENWGLGVFKPGDGRFLCFFAGMPGAGGSKDAPTGYVAPTFNEILDHNITYDYHYTLILGKLSEIRNYVYAHSPKPAPPDYVFAKDRRHWIYANASDLGWPVKGELWVKLTDKDPQMIGPPGIWKASDAPVIRIRAAFRTTESTAQIFWSRYDSPEFSADKSVTFKVVPDGIYRTYEVNLAASPGYRGMITGIRLDPEPNGHPGDYVRVSEISLKPVE